METPFDPQSAPLPPRQSFLRRIGGGALSFAILLHVVLLVLGAIWIFQVIRVPEKVVDFMPSGGGGGGERGAQTQIQQKKRAQITPSANVKRVFAEGVVSNYVIPDPGDTFGEISSLSAITGGGLGGGFGGSGNGNGFGKGDGAGPGAGALGSGKINPFGMVDPTSNALEGTFYDLKQTKDRHTTDITNDGVREVIREFVTKGWREKSLDKYFKANRTLYQNRIHIPLMNAEGAPAAFECEKEVQPSRWVVVYRGVVTPPKSGRYRFVGAGDDVLVVRFNGKHVFDHGFTSGTTAIDIARNAPLFKGTAENDDLKKSMRRDYPMKIPVTYYTYPSTRNWNGAIGGLAVGAGFDAMAGKSYPIEILISEIPGGLFCASLHIEEVGEKYEKASTGSPILPLFRLDQGLPQVDPNADNAPPFDSNGPVWKRLNERGRLDI